MTLGGAGGRCPWGGTPNSLKISSQSTMTVWHVPRSSSNESETNPGACSAGGKSSESFLLKLIAPSCGLNI